MVGGSPETIEVKSLGTIVKSGRRRQVMLLRREKWISAQMLVPQCNRTVKGGVYLIVVPKTPRNVNLFHVGFEGSLEVNYNEWKCNTTRSCCLLKKKKIRRWGVLGRVCVKGTVLLHVLWRKRCVQIQKIQNTNLWALKDYCIEFVFHFPRIKAKYLPIS